MATDDRFTLVINADLARLGRRTFSVTETYIQHETSLKILSLKQQKSSALSRNARLVYSGTCPMTSGHPIILANCAGVRFSATTAPRGDLSPPTNLYKRRTTALLTEKDITHFKRQGFVVLPDLIDPEHVEAWNEQFWNHIAAVPDNTTSWPDSYVQGGFSTDPLFGHLPQMNQVVEQLGGNQFAGGGGSMLVHWPRSRTLGHAGKRPYRRLRSRWLERWFYARRNGLLRGCRRRGRCLYILAAKSPYYTSILFEHPSHIDGSFTEREDWKERNWGILRPLAPRSRTVYGTGGRRHILALLLVSYRLDQYSTPTALGALFPLASYRPGTDALRRV